MSSSAVSATINVFGRVIAAVACLTLGLPTARGADPAGGEALIVAGIVGDDEHEALFADALKHWHAWLTGPMRFEPDSVRVLYDESVAADLAGPVPPDACRGPATREAIEREVAAIKARLGPDDRLWVFLLGHANYDGRHAFLHLHGPDMNESEFAKLFAGINCREQVFWLTTPAAGWMLPAFSAKGRVVISATARDAEFNETEFPHALTTAMAQPRGVLDADGDGALTLLELFDRAVAEVAARFDSDHRIATEHAQLDDDGDGVGTEQPRHPGSDSEIPSGNKKVGRDGALAARIVLPYGGHDP
jgi:hypothetical protein